MLFASVVLITMAVIIIVVFEFRVDFLLDGNVFEKLTRSVELFRVHVRYLKLKLILDAHDDFYMVKRVETEVIVEVRVKGQLVGVNLVVEPEDEENSLSDVIIGEGRLVGIAYDELVGCSRDRQENAIVANGHKTVCLEEGHLRGLWHHQTCGNSSWWQGVQHLTASHHHRQTRKA